SPVPEQFTSPARTSTVSGAAPVGERVGVKKMRPATWHVSVPVPVTGGTGGRIAPAGARDVATTTPAENAPATNTRKLERISRACHFGYGDAVSAFPSAGERPPPAAPRHVSGSPVVEMASIEKEGHRHDPRRRAADRRFRGEPASAARGRVPHARLP